MNGRSNDFLRSLLFFILISYVTSFLSPITISNVNLIDTKLYDYKSTRGSQSSRKQERSTNANNESKISAVSSFSKFKKKNTVSAKFKYGKTTGLPSSKLTSQKKSGGNKSISTSSQNQQDFLENMKIGIEERLQKVISRAGIASRREAEKYIIDGRVVVNGKVITELGVKVNPRKDIIMVDGKKVNIPDSKDIFWILLNKPKSCLSIISDSLGRETIADIVPKAKELRLIPVGGLDRDATGLLLMTNDIGWIHPLTHPSFRHKTRYEVVIKGLPKDEDFDKLRVGLKLPEEKFKLRPCSISIVDVDKLSGMTLLDITIEESVSSQIEKMIETLGCEVVRLKRLEFGPIKLKGLKRGMWKELTSAEIDSLKESCKLALSSMNNDSLSSLGEVDEV